MRKQDGIEFSHGISLYRSSRSIMNDYQYKPKRRITPIGSYDLREKIEMLQIKIKIDQNLSNTVFFSSIKGGDLLLLGTIKGE